MKTPHLKIKTAGCSKEADAAAVWYEHVRCLPTLGQGAAAHASAKADHAIQAESQAQTPTQTKSKLQKSLRFGRSNRTLHPWR